MGFSDFANAISGLVTFSLIAASGLSVPNLRIFGTRPSPASCDSRKLSLTCSSQMLVSLCSWLRLLARRSHMPEPRWSPVLAHIQ